MGNGIRSKMYADIMSFNSEVTGSLNLGVVKFPDCSTTKFAVDCGLFQERKYAKKNNKLPFDAETLDFMLVTHNHIDHIGRLPFAVKKGFYRNIYMTKETSYLIKPALKNSHRVLRSTAKRDHHEVLYSEMDVQRTMEKVVGCDYEETVQITPNIKATFLSNGHLIGAAMILLQISYEGCEDINLLFTGDYNNKNMFFDVLPVPDWVKKLPLTIIQESTYGNMDSTEIVECYEDNTVKAINERKTVLTPVFSLGRSQEILYVTKKLQEAGKLSKDIPIYFDGKLAIEYTKLYLSGKLKSIKEEMRDFLPEHLIYVDEKSRTKALYDQSSKIILTTSGMGTYGPAQTYIPEYLSRENALIHFTGYTAEGTLGEKIKTAKKNSSVNVGGVMVIKKADVEYTMEYSAHAKADEMIDFLRQFSNIRFIGLNHGEEKTKMNFGERILKEIKPKRLGILEAETLFRVDAYGLIKAMSTKFV